jgi:hypothetical protein
MAFSFIKNDENSFSYYSRVYEVYDYNKGRYLRTAFVIGYLPGIEKYYITMLGYEPLYSNYVLRSNDISTEEFISILKEFFNFLEFMDPSDFIIDEVQLIDCAPLIKENFFAYVSEVEPYFNEDIDDYDGSLVTYDDDHSRYLMDEDIFIPSVMCNDSTEEYEPYDYNIFSDYWLNSDSVEFYCEIDFDKLYSY